jgi:hypothetical protein
MNQKQRQAIKKQFEKMAESPYKVLAEIDIEDLDFNPFLLRALGLDTPEAIAEFMVGQRLERSLVTSLGKRIQNAARALAEGTGTEGGDILVRRGGKKYCVEIKAGPNNINKAMMKQMNADLKSARRRDPDLVGLLGMAYGHPDRVSGIIRGYADIEYRSGRAFWTLVTGVSDTADEVYKLADEVSREAVARHGGKHYRSLVKEREKAVAEQIRAKYGDGKALGRALFDDNM